MGRSISKHKAYASILNRGHYCLDYGVHFNAAAHVGLDLSDLDSESDLDSDENIILCAELEEVFGRSTLVINKDKNGNFTLSPRVQKDLKIFLLRKAGIRGVERYLESQGMYPSNRVDLADLSDKYEKIMGICTGLGICVAGIDGGCVAYSWDDPLCFIVRKQGAGVISVKDLAQFRKRMNALMGGEIKVEERSCLTGTHDLETVVNSYRFSQLIRSAPDLSEVQEYIKSHKAKLDLDFNVEGYTPLHNVRRSYQRVHRGDNPTIGFDVASCLIGQGADHAAFDKHGDTLLHVAASEGDAAYCKFLLGNNVDPNSANKKGLFPIELAANHQHKKTIGLLYPVTTEMDSQRRLMVAVTHDVIPSVDADGAAAPAGDLTLTKALLADNSDLLKIWTHHEHPLFVAAKFGNLEMVNLLVANGAVPKQLEDGQTLLHVNCAWDDPNPKLIEKLVKGTVAI